MMRIDRRGLIGLALAVGAVPAVHAANPRETLPLWPGRPPGARRTLPRPGHRGTDATEITGIARPTIAVYRPRIGVPNRSIGILVVPGGGYEFEASENEGSQIADRLSAMGYTAFVLTYRLPAEGWDDRADVPLQDAQRALRLIRAGAASFGIDPAPIGVIGFSAGGHLATSLATAYDEPVYRPVDAADRLSARPAFAGVMYAVTTLALPETHIGTRERLLGPSPDAAAVVRRSPLDHIDARTPPCFVLHAIDDTVVPVSCGLRWMHGCIAAKVPVEAHILERGGHGFGVHLPDGEPGSLWPELFDRWIRRLPGMAA